MTTEITTGYMDTQCGMRKICGKTVSCMGMAIIGLLAIPAGILIVLIYLIWQATNTAVKAIETKRNVP